MRNQEELIETFKDEEIKYEDAVRSVTRAIFRGKMRRYSGTLSCSKHHGILMVYTLCSINIPPKKREAAMEFITRANFGMRVGMF